MRFSTLFTLTTLCCGLAFAADGPQTAVYVEGDLGWQEGSGATVDTTDYTWLLVDNGSAQIEIPYERITRLKVGEPINADLTADEPLYKVWKLHKRILTKKTQKLTFEFEGRGGRDQSLTLDLDEEIASDIVDAVGVRLAMVQRAREAKNWWGDSLWKTHRNRDEWGGAGTLATRE